MSEEFVLGKDVTRRAAGRSQEGGTAVLSVRLHTEDLALLETLSGETGKNYSQIVREAIRRYSHESERVQPTVTISSLGGTFSTGKSSQISGGSARGFLSEGNVRREENHEAVT